MRPLTSREQPNVGHRHRLRERFIKSGIGAFHDYEAVELLLTLAIPRQDVKGPAKEAIRRFKTFRGVLDAPLEELRLIPGFGEVAPIALHIVREAATLYLRQANMQTGFAIDNPEALHNYCRMAMGALPHEEFRVIFLDSGNKVLGDQVLEEGTVDRAAVYPRQVMDAALRRHAAKLVFVHNHPNGNLVPSEHDKTLTRALVLAATTLQIGVLDHLIVSSDGVFSFREEGLL